MISETVNRKTDNTMIYTTPHRKLKFELDKPTFSIMPKGYFKYFTNINLKRHPTKNNYNMII